MSEAGESGEPHAPRFEPEEEAVSYPGKSSQPLIYQSRSPDQIHVVASNVVAEI